MNWRAIPFCVVAISVGISARPAWSAGNLIVAETTALCVANHADPSRVLAAADAAGWTTGPHGLGLVKLSGSYRTKTLGDGSFLLLKTGEQTKDSKVGLLRTRTCAVTGSGPVADGLPEAIQSMLGHAPSEKVGAVWTWIYDDAPDGRRYLPASRSGAFTQALVDRAAIEWSTDTSQPNRSVLYEETSLVGEVATGYLVDGARHAMDRGDYREMLRLLETAAARGDADALVGLGFAQQRGLGVPADAAAAAGFYQRAADAGSADGQYNLAILYKEGIGVPQSFAKAAELLRSPAEQGDARALVNLGVLYATGSGISKNYEEALRLFRLAAAKDDAYGEYYVGKLYELGYGVPKDMSLARSWIEKAADKKLDLAVRWLQQHPGG